VKAPKIVAYEIPLEHTSYSDEKIDDQKVLDFVKSPQTAHFDEALNDQNIVDSIKAQENDDKLDDQENGLHDGSTN